MTNEEKNSAELEAEEILKAEFNKARAEECPEGENCSVHFRVDSVITEPEMEYVRLINYHGEYAVVTEDNPQVGMAMAGRLFSVLAGKPAPALPDRWETVIFYVGESTLGDLANKTVEEQRSALRYSWKHDIWENLIAVHQNTVAMLEAGLIDVSKPLDPED